MQQTQPLETPVQPSTALFWPEAAREQPRLPDPFPHRMFLTWLVPGLVGTIILIAIAIYLEQRANRQIIYQTQDGSLASVRADGADKQTLHFTDLEDAIFGKPYWAPDSNRFAVIVYQRKTPQSQVLVAQPGNTTPTLITIDEPNIMFFAGDPWSADSAYLSLLSTRPDHTVSLLIADVQQARVVPVGIELALQASIDWRQQTNELLVTALTEGITPTLHIVGIDGQLRPIPLPDQQVSHFDGAWSPDGQQIAYVASTNLYESASSIWVANSDGSNARQIVQDGQNFAPVWAPRGDLLFFTRLLPKTNDFELYRVRPDGQGLSRVGPGTLAWHIPGVDRAAILSWSPDGSQIFFQDFVPQKDLLTVYIGRYDGSNAQAMFAEPSFGNAFKVIRWAPTSRALLIDSQSRGMFMLWIDADRPAKQFPVGSFPSWQP
jgi:hypothetical protein